MYNKILEQRAFIPVWSLAGWAGKFRQWWQKAEAKPSKLCSSNMGLLARQAGRRERERANLEAKKAEILPRRRADKCTIICSVTSATCNSPNNPQQLLSQNFPQIKLKRILLWFLLCSGAFKYFHDITINGFHYRLYSNSSLCPRHTSKKQVMLVMIYHRQFVWIFRQILG